MLRAIVAVILGVVAMWLLGFGLVAAAYSAFGAERVFAPGTWATTTAWNVAGLTIGFIAAAAGGAVIAKVGRSCVPVLALAAIVLGLRLAYGDCPSFAAHRSVISVIETSTRDVPPARTAEPSLGELCYAQEPREVAYVNPLLGVGGVLIGAGVMRGRRGGGR
jgi:hypothetical protein